MCAKVAAMTEDDTTVPEDGAGAGRDALPPDERELLDAFDRLVPSGSVEGVLQWGFDDAMRRLSSEDERGTWVEPWDGLPADLWDRGRGAKASERVLGDVITSLAQELTEYSQRIVDDVRRTIPVDAAVFDALRYLEARVVRLEAAADPLGLRPAELPLPVPDAAEWAAEVPGWLGDTGGLPVVVGELGDRSVVDSLSAAGHEIDAVDPRAAVAWALGDTAAGRSGQLRATVGDVVEHLGRLPVGRRSAVVLAGCLDRASLPGKVHLVTAARDALAPGGTLVLLVSDQETWDTGLAPPVRDLLPGRPFHPDTWAVVLGRLGMAATEVHGATRGGVHAVVARKPR